MTDTPIVDVDTLRDQVRDKYPAVAVDPDATDHFHTRTPVHDGSNLNPERHGDDVRPRRHAA